MKTNRCSLIAFVLVFCGSIAQATPLKWTMEVSKKNRNGMKHTILQFKKSGKIASQYIPPKNGPLGLVSQEGVALAGKKYFVTLWFKGPHHVLVRVFDPSIKNTPLCEIFSMSEKAPLRIVKNQLQVEIVPEPKNWQDEPPWMWKNCRKL